MLFFSPTCGHCEYVINDLLFPVWFPQFGGEPEVLWDEAQAMPGVLLATNGTLEILLVDVCVDAGLEMHRAVGEALGHPGGAPGIGAPPGGGGSLPDRLR